ncbi:MAG: ABC transporter ATP-binding protein [Spirochaetaceae bacterium]|nr:ABC transporter ATP-binding protein [Spirochaetaceae bacterium]
MIKNFIAILQLQDKKIQLHYVLYTFVSCFHVVVFDLLPLLYAAMLNEVQEKIFPTKSLMLYAVGTVILYLAVKLWSLSNQIIKNKILKKMVHDLCSKFLTLPKKELKENTSTFWRTYISDDVYYVAELFTDFVFTIPSSILSVLITFGIIFYYNAGIFILSLVYVVLNCGLLYLRKIKLMPKIETHQILKKDLKSLTDSFYNGYIDIYGSSCENFVSSILQSHLDKNFFYNRKVIFGDLLIKFLITLVHFTYITSVLVVFKQNVFLNIGVVVLIITKVQDLWKKISDVIYDMNCLQEYEPYLKRILNIYAMPDESRQLATLTDDLVNYKDVSLGYGNEILRNINFSFDVGDHLIITGKSGIGKTTLIRSFENPSLVLNGDANFSKDFLEKTIYLYQNPIIFNRSIRENLTLGDTQITDEKIISWLELLKLDTLKNEDGIFDLDRNMKTLKDNISGGEKNRLSIIRVLLRNPDVVILDEPLVGISGEMRKEIIHILKNAFTSKSIMLITHADDLKDMCTNSKVLNLEGNV